MGLSAKRHELLSIIGLGIATLLLMNGNDTSSSIGESVLHSVHSRNPDQIDAYAGYYGATVMYASFAISTLISPWICYKIGAKFTIFVGSIAFTLYLLGFFHLNAYFYYASQTVLGLGFALYYTGQGQYLSEHSTRESISRNSALLCSIGNQSMLLGGLSLIAIYLFTPASEANTTVSEVQEQASFRVFPDSEIFIIFAALTASSVIANVVFACLPSKQHNSIAQQEPVQHATFKNQIGLMWETITEKRIFCLLPFFIFYGLHITFFLITFPTCFAFSHHLANNHLLPGIYNASAGVGNLIVGLFIQRMSKKNKSFGLIPTMFTQVTLTIFMYSLTVLSTPNYSTMMPTTSDPLWIHPGTVTVILLGCMHGMIDVCSATMRSFVCTVAVPKNRIQAYSIAKLFQSLATCFGSFIAPSLSIFGWITLLIGTQCISVIGFCYVCRNIHNGEKKVMPLTTDVPSSNEKN